MSDFNPHRPIDYAYTHHIAGRLWQAETGYREIMAADPHGPDGAAARSNLIALLRDQQRWAEAEEAIEEALACDPDDEDMRYRLATSRLAAGDYERGWALYESRRRMKRKPVISPALPFPEWQGNPVGSLLVWPEQGFGDIIQFSRFLPLLRARGIRVILAVQPSLARLLSGLADQVIALENPVRLPPVDAWIFAGSLPWRLKAFDPAQLPPPALEPLPKGGEGVGVVTRGRPTHANDADRSASTQAAAALLALPGAVNLDPAETGARDFQDTAEIIAGLRAVVTVDTAVAHLAGSLNKPTAIILPYVGVDWRWMRNGRTSVWYPSATLYRQAARGDWSTPLAEIHQDLFKA